MRTHTSLEDRDTGCWLKCCGTATGAVSFFFFPTKMHKAVEMEIASGSLGTFKITQTQSSVLLLGAPSPCPWLVEGGLPLLIFLPLVVLKSFSQGTGFIIYNNNNNVKGFSST